MGNKVRIRIKRTTLLSRMKEVLKKKGVFYIFKNTIKRLFSYYYFKIFKSHRKFKEKNILISVIFIMQPGKMKGL